MDQLGSHSESSLGKNTPWLPVALVVLVVVVLTVCNWRQLDSAAYSSDQIAIATVLLKYHDPTVFPAEEGLRPVDVYAKTYLGLLDVLVSLTGGTKKALFWLGTVPLMIFAGGMYVLLFIATSNGWVAAIITIASLWFRMSFEGQLWQIWDFSVFLPRTITLALVPWLLLACGRWLGRWELIGIFAALGITANYHPFSSLYLAVIFGLTLLFVRRSFQRHVLVLAVSVVIFSLASAPYFLEVRRAVQVATASRVSQGPPPTLEQIEQARQEAEYGIFPPPFRMVCWVGFHLALPALAGVGGFLVRRRRLNDFDRTLVAFLCAVIVYSVGGAATEVFLRVVFKVHKSLTFMRAFHLVYLPLWVFCGWLVEDLWNRQSGRARQLAVLLCALLLVPASATDSALRWIKHRGDIPPRQMPLEHDRDFVAVCQWMRAHTRPADICLVPIGWHLFPLLSHRSIVAVRKERGFILYEPVKGVETSERLRSVREAYEDPSPDRLREIAKRYGAQYIVVVDRELADKPIFQSGAYRVYKSP